MDDTRRFQLLFGPYQMPRCRVGRKLRCRLRGKVRVVAISDSPIQWPVTRRRGGPLSPILCGDLVKAVRRESNQAV